MPTRPSKRPLSEVLPGAALNKDELNKAGGLGRGRGGRSKGSSGTGTPHSATLQQTEPRTLAAGSRAQGGRKGSSYRRVRSLSPRQAATGSRIPVSMQLLPTLEPPPLEVQNAALGRGVVSHPAFTRCRISKGSLEAKPGRHAARLAVGMRSGRCHLHVGSSLGAGKEGSSERPSCVRCSSSHAGPTIPLLQGLPSVTPDRSSVLSGRKTPPAAPLRGRVPRRCGSKRRSARQC